MKIHKLTLEAAKFTSDFFKYISTLSISVVALCLTLADKRLTSSYSFKAGIVCLALSLIISFLAFAALTIYFYSDINSPNNLKKSGAGSMKNEFFLFILLVVSSVSFLVGLASFYRALI